MGKASRRKNTAGTTAKVAPAPFVRRPFEGLASETEWVALREIVPAATATARLADGGREVTIATVLPLAWPALHRADGTILVATQSGGSSGDASRDLARALVAALETEPGTPIMSLPAATEETPRLQDLLDTSSPLEVTLHEGFDFWIEGQELDGAAKESLERANETIVPSVKLAAAPSAYWCRMGSRTFLRLVLGDDEDAATDALARLHAVGESALDEGVRLLGAFRSHGLLVPVWDLDPERDAADYEDQVAAFIARYEAALATSEPLTPEERRARSGLLSRQVTIR
ncbi:DUF5926 family protein [Janibacter sp. G56]|uniref:DUF5926 family protein n=1 Tax=Janibacter sp. G56 TaxID=3418717 RepID=UPI003D00290D